MANQEQTGASIEAGLKGKVTPQRAQKIRKRTRGLRSDLKAYKTALKKDPSLPAAKTALSNVRAQLSPLRAARAKAPKLFGSN